MSLFFFCCLLRYMLQRFLYKAGTALSRGLATYAFNVSFGHPKYCFLTVRTPKCLGQDLLMMTTLEDSACSVTPTIQSKQLMA